MQMGNGTLGEPAKERASHASSKAGSKQPREPFAYRPTVDTNLVVLVHLIPALGKTKLSELKADQIQKLYSGKLATVQSPQSVLHIHRILHRALAQAMRWGYCVRNVCDLVDKPKVPRHEMQTFNLEHARAFLAAAEGDPFEALYVLALTTGMRQGGLKWADIDLDAGTLQARRTLGRIQGQGFVRRSQRAPVMATYRPRRPRGPRATEAPCQSA